MRSTVPDEVRRAVASFVRELGYTLAGHQLPVVTPDPTQIILGEDRAGDQVGLRDKMRPFLAFMILILETFGLGACRTLERGVSPLMLDH